MECFQCVNVLIEVGEWLVTKEKLGFSATYREILSSSIIIDEKIFEIMKRIIFLSNLISYEYHKITNEELVENG